MFALLIALLTISVASYVWLFYRHVKRFPKGPTPLPIIGNLLSINLRKLHEDFDRISKDYGDIFTVWLPKPCVVVMNLESIKEAFTKKVADDFGGEVFLTVTFDVTSDSKRGAVRRWLGRKFPIFIINVDIQLP